MAEASYVGNKIIVECDCGAIHKLTKGENEEILISSTFKKPKKEEKPNERIEEEGKTEERNTKPKPKSDGWF